MKPMKTLATTCLAAAVLSFGAITLTSCGPSAEDAIRQGITEELDSIKNLDEARMDEFATAAGADQLSVYGMDPQAFVTAYLAGFDYTIDDIVVNDNNAMATVTITCKKLSDFQTQLNAAAAELVNDEEVQALQGDELNSKIGATVMEVVEGLEATASDPINLELALKDNTWTPTADANIALSNAMFKS